MTPAEIATDSLLLLLWMALPVLAGWGLWRVVLLPRGALGERVAALLARRIGLVTLVGAAGPLMLLVVWVAPFPSGGAALLPLLGLVVHAAGSLAGWGLARLAGRSRREQGAYLLAGGSSNVLTFGGITVVLLLRSETDPHAETALGVLAIYRLLESPYYYLVAWPLAATVSAAGTVSLRWSEQLRAAVRSPTSVPALGIIAGALLNGAGVPRPEFLDGTADWLVRVNVVLLGVTVGLALRAAAPWRHRRPCLEISAIKFLLLPAVGVGLAWALGFKGPTLQVVAICASMPVAFMAVVGATLYRLDEELVGSFWLFTTFGMTVVVPVLAAVVPTLS